MNDEIVLKEIDSGKEYLVILPCAIGRDRNAGLVLVDQTVSHRHALIDTTADQIWIQDLKTNELVRVPQPDKERHQDPVWYDGKVFIYLFYFFLLVNKNASLDFGSIRCF